MRFAGIMIAAPICVLLPFLTMARTRPHEERGRCMAAQQRLAKLRAEITEVEQDIDAACAAGVTTDAPHADEEEALARATSTATTTSTSTATATAHVPWAQALGVPYTASGYRRRQTSGKPCGPPQHRPVRRTPYRMGVALEPCRFGEFERM
jgi:hypothetical protein